MTSVFVLMNFPGPSRVRLPARYEFRVSEHGTVFTVSVDEIVSVEDAETVYNASEEDLRFLAAVLLKGRYGNTVGSRLLTDCRFKKVYFDQADNRLRFSLEGTSVGGTGDVEDLFVSESRTTVLGFPIFPE